jgi:hypothetical protein
MCQAQAAVLLLLALLLPPLLPGEQLVQWAHRRYR